MSTNPPDLRPDLAPRARLSDPARPGQPTIGMVSLGCPKALVDSERILTRLRAEGYGISPDYAGAGAVIVNTCGFLDSAKAESLEAIGEALVALANDAKLRDRIGKANRAKARAQFDADRMIATYRRLYSSAMHGFDL